MSDNVTDSNIDIVSFENDNNFTSRYNQKIKELAAQYIIQVASPFRDMKQATDFDIKKCALAARIRRGDKLDEKYKYDITLRFRRESGAETEFSKVMAGHGDWFFYGHASGIGIDISTWYLIDLEVLRQEIRAKVPLKFSVIQNGDNQTSFIAFDLRSFKRIKELLIGSSEVVEYDPNMYVKSTEILASLTRSPLPSGRG